MMKSKGKTLLLLHILLLGYALTSTLSKLAGTKPFLSVAFVLSYGCVLVLLLIYAILWQHVLKKIPLSVAYANKGVVPMWGMLFGWLFWGEQITLIKLFALAIVFGGIYLVVIADE